MFRIWLFLASQPSHNGHHPGSCRHPLWPGLYWSPSFCPFLNSPHSTCPVARVVLLKHELDDVTLLLHSCQWGLLALEVKPMSLYWPIVFYVICPLPPVTSSAPELLWPSLVAWNIPGIFYLRAFAPPALPVWNAFPYRYLRSHCISFLLLL